jgi:peptide deformylase
MATLPIITGANNPILRKKTERIPKVTKKILKLIKDMQASMEAANGVGLAAPQVSQSLRLCIAMVNGKLTPLINPDITFKSKETSMDEEGCLSLPNVWLQIPRSTEITVTYTDEKGAKQERKLKDFDARVVQHEVDHLEGILIVDYVVSTKETLPGSTSRS